MTKRTHKIISAPPAADWISCGDQWQCPTCTKRFPRAGQGHSCSVATLADHFDDRPVAQRLFETFRSAVEQSGGPVRLSIAKTRIGFITQLTFAAIVPRKNYLRGHLLLCRRVESPQVVRIDDGPPYWVHHFEIRNESDLDVEFRKLIGESYQVGTKSGSCKPSRKNLDK